MRPLLVSIAVFTAGIGVYALPSLAELALVHRHLNPWLCCVALGDMLGCCILFLLGFRRMAVGIYIVASTLEAALLMSHALPPGKVVWISNLFPALALAAILIQAALRNLVLEEN
jgi:hypothetical protein